MGLIDLDYGLLKHNGFYLTLNLNQQDNRTYLIK